MSFPLSLSLSVARHDAGSSPSISRATSERRPTRTFASHRTASMACSKKSRLLASVKSTWLCSITYTSGEREREREKIRNTAHGPWNVCELCSSPTSSAASAASASASAAAHDRRCRDGERTYMCADEACHIRMSFSLLPRVVRQCCRAAAHAA